MRKLTLLLALILLGCNAEDGRQEAGKPSGIPNSLPYKITDQGITIYWESKKDPIEIEAYHYSVFDNWWIKTQECLGMEAEPPIIRITDDIHSICQNLVQDGGGYCRTLEPAPIVLNVRKAFDDPQDDFDVLEDIRTIVHEEIHHILELNGVLIHRDHQPDYLWECETL